MKQIFLLLVTICCIRMGSYSQNTVLWKITKPQSEKTSYLLGTNHSLSGNIFDSLPVIGVKIAESEIAVFESPRSDSAIAKYYRSKPVNQELSNLLTAEQKAFIRQGADTSNALHFDPLKLTVFEFYGYLSMGIKADIKNAYRHEQGSKGQNIELYLDFIATKLGKDKEYLEPDSVPLNSLRKYRPNFLMYFLMKNSIPSLIKKFQNPDTAKGKNETDKIQLLETAYLKFDHKYYFNKGCHGRWNKIFVKARNDLWMKRLPFLLGHYNCFISVGLLHLDRKCGLIMQLRKLGYIVTPVDVRNQ